MVNLSNLQQATIQQATIVALEELSDPAMKFVVEAWALNQTIWDPADPDGETKIRVPVLATEPCSIDTDHGKGYCYGPTGDALCLKCMQDWIELDKRANHTISVDVAA